jgi:hypothetical protein
VRVDQYTGDVAARAQQRQPDSSENGLARFAYKESDMGCIVLDLACTKIAADTAGSENGD